MLKNLNLFEVLQILSKNENVKAVAYVDGVSKEIKWSAEKNSTNGIDTYKEIVFKNLTGQEFLFKLTDIMIEQQNYNIWNIVSVE